MAADVQGDLDRQAQALGERLAAHFRDVYLQAMTNAPICNPALGVNAIGFRVWQGQALGIVSTPWFMNVILAPLAGGVGPQGQSGDSVSISLPVGKVDFLVGDLNGFGSVLMCSLFSPMDQFQDQAAALATAGAAIEGLLDAQTLAGAPEREIYPAAPVVIPQVPAAAAELDRRALLRGGLRSASTVAAP